MDVVIELFPNLLVMAHRARVVGGQDRHLLTFRQVTVALDQLFDHRPVVIAVSQTFNAIIFQD